MPTLLPDVAYTEAPMGPDMLARSEVYVPARLPQQLSGDLDQSPGCQACDGVRNVEVFVMVELDTYRLGRWRLDGILIRAGYDSFDFWQSMGLLLPPDLKTTCSRGRLINKDAHRCPR